MWQLQGIQHNGGWISSLNPGDVTKNLNITFFCSLSFIRSRPLVGKLTISSSGNVMRAESSSPTHDPTPQGHLSNPLIFLPSARHPSITAGDSLFQLQTEAFWMWWIQNQLVLHNRLEKRWKFTLFSCRLNALSPWELQDKYHGQARTLYRWVFVKVV